MSMQVPEKVRFARRDALMAEQQRVSRSLGAASAGRVMKVLVEKSTAAGEVGPAEVRSWEHGLVRVTGADTAGVADGGSYQICRGEADAPDIDGRVYVRGRLPVGQFANVRIIGHSDYDLLGEPQEAIRS
jgi:ribosomal protein S12 methylthiotransferase